MPSSNGQTASYIPDGYTQDFYFEEVNGIHGSIRGTFRPLSINQHAAVNRDLVQAGDDWERNNWVAARWIARQIVSWDLTKPGGERVDHTSVDEIMHLGNTIFNRLWNLVCNRDGGDLDPKHDAFDRRRRADNENVVSASRETPQEALEKN